MSQLAARVQGDGQLVAELGNVSGGDWRGLETETGKIGGEGWDTRDPGSLCSVEGQGEERKDVQDEGGIQGGLQQKQ